MYVKFTKSVNEYPAGVVVEMPAKFGRPYVQAKVALEVDKNGNLIVAAPVEEVPVEEVNTVDEEPDNG